MLVCLYILVAFLLSVIPLLFLSFWPAKRKTEAKLTSLVLGAFLWAIALVSSCVYVLARFVFNSPALNFFVCYGLALSMAFLVLAAQLLRKRFIHKN